MHFVFQNNKRILCHIFHEFLIQTDLRTSRRQNERLAKEIEDVRSERQRYDKANDISNAKMKAELEKAKKDNDVMRSKSHQYDELRSVLNETESKLLDKTREMKLVKDEEVRLRKLNEEHSIDIKNRIHTNEMLTMDKLYLTKEIEIITERCSRAEQESDANRYLAYNFVLCSDNCKRSVIYISYFIFNSLYIHYFQIKNY